MLFWVWIFLNTPPGFLFSPIRGHKNGQAFAIMNEKGDCIMPRKGEISEREKMEDGKRAMKNPVTKMAGFSMAMYMLTLMIL